MDFSLTDEQQRFKATIRDVARSEIRPHAQEWDRAAIPLPDGPRRKLAELGLVGITLPEAVGGSGAPLLYAVLAIEELARESQTAAWPVFEAAVGPARVIELFGTPEQRERWLPRIVRGDATMALAISEAHAGSAATDLSTCVEQVDGGLIVNGSKQWCSGAGHADDYLVYARTAEAPGSRGIGAIVVPSDAPGLTFGPRRLHMGCRGIPHADMFFDDCRVPADFFITPTGGFRQLFAAFSIERVGNAAMSLGLASSCLDRVAEYVKQRHQFGRPLMDFQAVQLTLADMLMRTDAARLLVWRAAANAGNGIPDTLESSVAKCYANETARFVADAALNLMGATGYSTDESIERHVRDSYGWAIAGGTTTMQRIRITSELLGARFDQRAGGSNGGAQRIAATAGGS